MNWKWGTSFGILVIVTLIAIVYAFVQTVKAQYAEAEVVKRKEKMEQLLVERDASAAEAARQNQLYTECQKELTECKSKGK